MIYTVENIKTPEDIRKCGGKGLNMFRLTQAMLPIPDWFIIPFDLDIQKDAQEIEAALDTLRRKAKYVAVRSSASVEDRGDLSFAGQFESYLYIQSTEELFAAIGNIRDSVRSEKVSEYLSIHGVERQGIEVGVIVQIMIDSDVSGVMFTANPVTGATNEVVINAAWGLGSLLVNGGNADTYVLDKKAHSILQKKIVKKKIKEVLDATAGSGVASIPVGDEQQNADTLDPELLSKLATFAGKIEDLYNAPQDIEWAIQGNSFFILQSRPITTLQFGEEKLWDSSNIAESYSGVTLPLTASFARYVYEIVYREVALTSGVPRRIVEDQKRIFENMLGFFRGRLYYNLYNWYRLLSFFPAYAFTKDSMEKMMSMRESSVFTEAIRMPKFFKLRYTIRAFYRYLTFSRELNFFKNNFEKNYSELMTNDVKHLPEEQLVNLYYRVETRMLHTWHTPIDNDFLAMVFYGLLRKLVDAWGLEKDTPAIYNDLLSGAHGVVSVEQTKELIMLAAMIKKNPELQKLFDLDTAEFIWEQIWSGHSDKQFAATLGQYLERFGTRFTNELKLEEPSIHEQPEKCIDLIKMYLTLAHETIQTTEKDRDLVKRRAEDIVRKKLNPLQRILLSHVLNRTKHFLKNREETRLMRAKVFGFVREVFKNIGKKLASRKSIDAAEDIFYLELEEVIHYIEGSAAFTDLRSLIAMRKKEFDTYKTESLPSRFVTRGLPYFTVPLAKKQPSHASGGLELQGLPCSPGIAEGIVAVMENVSYTIPEGATILVARHTDPGWTTIFSRFKGIVVECGGQLSHAAIVSRELGIPCVVGIENIMELVRNGDRLQLDGSRGEILIQRN